MFSLISWLVLLIKSLNPFTPQAKRNIFRYWDGKKWKFADPMVLVRELYEHPKFNFDKHWVGVVQGNPVDIGITAECVRDVFHVDKLDDNGNGMNESECVFLLSSFCEFNEELKKNISQPPTLPSSTEPMPDRQQPLPTTNGNSECGSISSEACFAELG